jgi:hypothetical protein
MSSKVNKINIPISDYDAIPSGGFKRPSGSRKIDKYVTEKSRIANDAGTDTTNQAQAGEISPRKLPTDLSPRPPLPSDDLRTLTMLKQHSEGAAEKYKKEAAKYKVKTANSKTQQTETEDPNAAKRAKAYDERKTEFDARKLEYSQSANQVNLAIKEKDKLQTKLLKENQLKYQERISIPLAGKPISRASTISQDFSS